MVELVRPVAEAGVPRAMARLGRMYAKGMGVPRDVDVAILALSQAAKGGVEWCRADLVLLRAERGTAEDKRIVLKECVDLDDRALAKRAVDVLLKGSSSCDVDTALELCRAMGLQDDEDMESLLVLCGGSVESGDIRKFEFPGATYESWVDGGGRDGLAPFLERISGGDVGRPSFTIFGSCVPRDALAISGLDGYCDVDAYYSFVSPLVFGFEPVERPDAEGSDKWMARCHALDLDKGLGRRLESKRSDYLVLDVADVRYSLQVYEGGGSRTAVTGSRLDSMYEDLMASMFPDGRSSVILPSALSEKELEQMMEPFMEAVGGAYGRDEIILVVPVRAERYRDRDGSLKRFGTGSSAANWLIRAASRILADRLGLTRVVSVPESVVALEGHKWGLDRLHYTEDMYQYIGGSIMGYAREDCDERSAPSGSPSS